MGGGNERHLPYQTYAAGEDLGQTGGLGAQPPGSNGWVGGNKGTYLIGTMLVEKVSASLSSCFWRALSFTGNPAFWYIPAGFAVEATR